jgi:hypothetical protein
MTEARRNGCNCRTTGVHCFIGLDLRLVSSVTLVLSSHYCYVIIVLIRLKQVDVKWLFDVVICDRCISWDFHYSGLCLPLHK